MVPNQAAKVACLVAFVQRSNTDDSIAGSSGLVMKSFMPAFLQARRSSSMAAAVSAMMGVSKKRPPKARMARVALDHRESEDPFYRAKLATARFYFAFLLPETTALMRSARAGVKPLMAMDASLF